MLNARLGSQCFALGHDLFCFTDKLCYVKVPLLSKC